MRHPETPKKVPKRALVHFLEELAQTGNVSHSAKTAGFGRATAYRYYEEDPLFALAWDDAMEEAADALEAEARRRAHDGVVEPVFHKGEVCGHVRKFSDTLLIFLMKGARPEKYRDRVDVSAKVEHVAIDMKEVEATSFKDAMATRDDLLARHRMLEGSKN